MEELEFNQKSFKGKRWNDSLFTGTNYIFTHASQYFKIKLLFIFMPKHLDKNCYRLFPIPFAQPFGIITIQATVFIW